MFRNLPKEIIFYSMIPFILIVLFDIILFFTIRKKEIDNETKEEDIKKNFNYHYLMKLSMMIGIGFVLPLICGYTWWVIESFLRREIFFDNFAYIVLIIFLSLCLLTLIIWIYLKSLDLTKINEETGQKSEA